MDMDIDAKFKLRLEQAVIDSGAYEIMIDSEPHANLVAEVCRDLGLPTPGPEAAEQRRVSGLDNLQRHLGLSAPPFEFPLIAKPIIGTRIMCVSEVSNVDELGTAVEKDGQIVMGHQDTLPIVLEALIEPFARSIRASSIIRDLQGALDP
ncbi:hypothetical protein HRG_001859 [Hirsutella rhossiliensis]|uniref:Uncharacterized protein n=1 Tax=Hirsutella rhossiliensis TaxID=111463 RepID=A0A9P8N3X5_9HYPO|nr:uncharacterized protein HRG_01859 [Hirsutella rhossiliensis]KAH0966450.1 hypothetical protein HRG_01859 [Hirsutella rhossiliensis]